MTDKTYKGEPRPVVDADMNGNAYSIMGACRKAMRRAGCSEEHIMEYVESAKSGDYDNLIQVSMRYCEVE